VTVVDPARFFGRLGVFSRLSPLIADWTRRSVTGTLQAVGGTSGAGPRALSGQVTLNGSGGKIATITVSANGRFSVPATVGTYTVSAHSPQYKGGTADCHASGPITVIEGATTKVEVDCQGK
jgi:hypothetical protein